MIKKTPTYIILAILMISCQEKKETTAENSTTEKTDSLQVAAKLTFEEELLAKSKLSDTLAMASYRTTGIFIGVNQLKDSIKATIDVEAHKVTGTLAEIQRGKPVDSIFEGILKNKIIIPTRGLNKNSILTISGNILTVKRGSESSILTKK